MSVWIAGGAVLAGVGGAAISANATSKAQAGANATNQRIADAQNAQLWNQYLLSRGLNPGGLTGVPGEAGSAVNTMLPMGAMINGVPAEQLILQQIFGQGGLTSPTASGNYTSQLAIDAFLNENPDVVAEINAAREGSDDQRSVGEWLRAHVLDTEAAVGGGTFTNLLKTYAERKAAGQSGENIRQQAAAGPMGPDSGLPPSSNPTLSVPGALSPEAAQRILPQGFLDLQEQALKAAGNVYNGGFLKTELDALKQIEDARIAQANLGFERNAEMRTNAGNVLGTNLTGLDALLGVRRDAAGNILNTELTGLREVLGSRQSAAGDLLNTELAGLANVRGVGEAGAQGIYGAELTSADTYENAVKQATSKTLEQQRAQRALRGFGGGSSTDQLMRARTLAAGYQQAGGARAQAGVNLQALLAQVRSAEAAGQLGARTRSTSSMGEAAIADAIARMGSNTKYSTTVGAASEQDALDRLTANLTHSNALAGILDSDVKMNVAGANVLNAGDRAQVIGGDIARQLGATGLASSIYGNTLGATNATANTRYADTNALLDTLGFFRQAPQQAPSPVAPNIQPVLGSGQIAGSALSAIGSGVMNYANTQSLIKAMNTAPNRSNGTAAWGGAGTNYAGMLT